MTNAAKRDGNGVPVRLAVSNADGTTILQIQANPTTHALSADDNNTGSDLTGSRALTDANGVATMLAVSSVDGITPVPLYIDSVSGKLLVKSL